MMHGTMSLKLYTILYKILILNPMHFGIHRWSSAFSHLRMAISFSPFGCLKKRLQ